MAQQAQIPKFGNWETNSNVQYTQYFEITRKGKGVNRPINPNNPIQNPKHEAFVGPAPRSPNVGPTAQIRRREEIMVRKSPRHRYQVDNYNNGSNASPSWERKGETEGRPRARGQGSETPERGSGLPKFGEWDIKNPSEYTQVFDRVREEKRVGSGSVPISPNNICKSSKKQHDSYEPSSGFSCFGWCRKR